VAVFRQKTHDIVPIIPYYTILPESTPLKTQKKYYSDDIAQHSARMQNSRQDTLPAANSSIYD